MSVFHTPARGYVRTMLNRRMFLLAAGSALAGCSTAVTQSRVEPVGYARTPDPYYVFIDVSGESEIERGQLVSQDIAQLLKENEQ